MRSLMSSGTRPLNVQMMLTTGMVMFGKMSVGVRTIASAPRIRMSIDATTNVYGRLSASLTIHMIHPRLGRNASIKSILGPVFRSLGIQSRDQSLGCWGYGDASGQDDVPRRNLFAVHTAVCAIFSTDCGTFRAYSPKQAPRPFVCR